MCEGDTVIVNVHNELTGGQGTSIHWHGILQHGSQHMDGVGLVTQCPIPIKSSFEYRSVKCLMFLSVACSFEKRNRVPVRFTYFLKQKLTPFLMKGHACDLCN